MAGYLDAIEPLLKDRPITHLNVMTGGSQLKCEINLPLRSLHIDRGHLQIFERCYGTLECLEVHYYEREIHVSHPSLTTNNFG